LDQALDALFAEFSVNRTIDYIDEEEEWTCEFDLQHMCEVDEQREGDGVLGEPYCFDDGI
jgi:hypothetical protein